MSICHSEVSRTLACIIAIKEVPRIMCSAARRKDRIIMQSR